MSISFKPIETESDVIYVKSIIRRETNNGHFLENPNDALDVLIAFAAHDCYSLPGEDGSIRYSTEAKLVKANIFLIIKNNERVGFILVVGSNEFVGHENGSAASFGSEAEILMIAVDQRHKRKGIGKQATSDLIEHLKSQQVKTIKARAKKKSTAMCTILEGVGFTLHNQTNQGSKHYSLNVS